MFRTLLPSTLVRQLSSHTTPPHLVRLYNPSQRFSTLPRNRPLALPTKHTRSAFHIRSATTLRRKPSAPEAPDVYRSGDPTIHASHRAITQLLKIVQRENNPALSLRVAVEPGGCHGYQYKINLTDCVEQDDFQFEVHPRVFVLVDSVSLALVNGSEVDFVTELIGEQFVVRRNPQAKGAGCGCGVSWEPIV